MKELNCETLEVNSLTNQIYQIRLQAVNGELFDFKGGQYLYLLMPDGKRIPLSIASAPEQKSFIELHIRLIPGHELAASMLNLFKTAKKLHIDGPYGQCVLRESENNIVIIAGGTGFSPMKSLLESALAKPIKRKISLYLGAQTEAELYQTPLIESWDTTNTDFNYVPVVSEAGGNWQGRIGFPHQIALNDIENAISGYDFYISGSETMVMNVYQCLLKAGANKHNIFSDILDIKREMGELI